MNAAVINSFDAPPRYTSFSDPVAAEGEMVVDVIAAGLHPIVKAFASGSHYRSAGALPFIPGLDGVARHEDGRLIFFGMARPPFGTFCERSLTNPKMCIPLPEGLEPATVAGIVNPGMSSWIALTKRAGFVAGENVLVLGATGVAGQLAVQIAKHLGAQRIVAAGRNPAVLEKLRDLGADAVVALDEEHESLVASLRRELGASRVDVVLDYLWGSPAQAVLEAIAQGGRQQAAARVRFVQIGESAGKTIPLPAAILRGSAIELLGSGFGSASVDELFKILAEFLQVAARSHLKIDTKPVPLRDVEAVWNAHLQGARFVFHP